MPQKMLLKNSKKSNEGINDQFLNQTNQTQTTEMDNVNTNAAALDPQQTEINEINNSTIHNIERPEQSAFDETDQNANPNQSLFDTVMSPRTDNQYRSFVNFNSQTSSNSNFQAATHTNLNQINEEQKSEESETSIEIPNFNRQNNLIKEDHGNRGRYMPSSECLSNDQQSFTGQESNDCDSVENYVYTEQTAIKTSKAHKTPEVASVQLERPTSQIFDDSRNQSVGARIDAHLLEQGHNRPTTHYLQNTINSAIEQRGARQDNDSNIQSEMQEMTRRVRSRASSAKQQIEEQKDKIIERVQEAAENTTENAPEPRPFMYDAL